MAALTHTFELGTLGEGDKPCAESCPAAEAANPPRPPITPITALRAWPVRRPPADTDRALLVAHLPESAITDGNGAGGDSGLGCWRVRPHGAAVGGFLAAQVGDADGAGNGPAHADSLS